MAVATSIQRRELEFQAKGDPPNGQVSDFDYCVDLAMTYVETAEAAATKTPHFYRARFEDVQSDASGQLTRLAEFCELEVSRRQVDRAAATIRPTKSDTLQQVQARREILSRYPLAAKLGYTSD